MSTAAVPTDDGPRGQVRQVGGATVFLCDAAGPLICSGQDALDVIGQAWGSQATLIAIPAGRFEPAFFRLDTGLAGEFIQKIVNYRLSIAIIGDIADQLAASSALRAFVHESNRGRQVWFLGDLDQLDDRLSNRSTAT
jgi:hypothetical protein